MFELIFIIIIIYLCVKKSKISANNNIFLFYKVMKNQGFSNVKNVYSTPSYGYVKADLHGENFLFEVKNTSDPIGKYEINSLYDMAKKSHIHNCILVYSNNPITPEVMRKIEDYNIQLWDTEKMQSLMQNLNTNIQENTYESNVLHTSNTSDDKCKIEPSYNPIKDGQSIKNSILSGLFDKPDRL